MSLSNALSSLASSPVVAVHASAMLSATLIGPLAIWARLGTRAHPRLHRAFGYAWVTLMLAACLSALFIESRVGPRIAGFGLIHLFVPLTLASLVAAFWFLARGHIRAHRITLISLYVSTCLITGAFTLLPGRLLGQWVWHRWLGLI